MKHIKVAVEGPIALVTIASGPSWLIVIVLNCG